VARGSCLRLRPKSLIRGGGLATLTASMAQDCNADLLVVSAGVQDRLSPHLHRSKMADILCAAPRSVVVSSHKDGSALDGGVLLSAETSFSE
jgi:hypothetical protein